MDGLGDSVVPFEKLGQQLNLPQTAVLSVQAPERVPFLLDEECFQWWPSFDQLGERESACYASRGPAGRPFSS